MKSNSTDASTTPPFPGESDLGQLSMEQLVAFEDQLWSSHSDSDDATKRLVLVQREIAKRRVASLLLDDGVDGSGNGNITSTSSSASPLQSKQKRIEQTSSTADERPSGSISRSVVARPDHPESASIAEVSNRSSKRPIIDQKKRSQRQPRSPIFPASSTMLKAMHGSKSRTKSRSRSSTAHRSAFVTESGKAGKKNSFRERARAANLSRKAKEMERSEEYQKNRLDQKLEVRRREIMQRMEERKARRRKAEEAREEKRRKYQQRKMEEGRKLQEDMERAAEIARASAVAGGSTPEEAVVSAAAAAAALLDDNVLADSDSDCSLFDDNSSSDADNSRGSGGDDDGSTTDAEGMSEPFPTDIAESASSIEPSDASISGPETVDLPPSSLHVPVQRSSGDNDDDINELDKDIGSINCVPGSLTPPPPVLSIDMASKPSQSLDYDFVADPVARPLSADENDSSSVGSNLSGNQCEYVTMLPKEQREMTLVYEPSTFEGTSDTSSGIDSIEDQESMRTTTEARSPTSHAYSPAAIPATPSRSFVSVYPHFWTIFTAFAETSNGQVPKRSMIDIDKLLQRQVKNNEEFLRLMSELTELTSENFQVPASCNSRVVEIASSPRPDVTNLIADVLVEPVRCSEDDGTGDPSWNELPADLGLECCWNLLWTWTQPKVDVDKLLVCQKINRFKGTRCLTRKDLLKASIQRFNATRVVCPSGGKGRGRSKSGRALDFQSIMPLTFILPQEYNAFVTAFSSIQRISGDKAPNLWISKPIGSSRGRGIEVINDIADVSYSQPIVIQRYLMQPLLFRGFKFDLRLYVLVTHFNELEAFIYSEGLARFATKPFSDNPESIYDEQIHLTNSSIQKDYWAVLDSSHPVRMAGSDGGGNKVRLTWLMRRLEAGGIDARGVWQQIKDLCRLTLVAVDAKIPQQPNCFEIFGFDVILTDELQPLLIEVNACPSLCRDSDLDADIKEDLIRDTIKLVYPPTIDREALTRICKRRLGRPTGGTGTNTISLEEDLREIFMGRVPRQIGERPQYLGNYERLQT